MTCPLNCPTFLVTVPGNWSLEPTLSQISAPVNLVWGGVVCCRKNSVVQVITYQMFNLLRAYEIWKYSGQHIKPGVTYQGVCHGYVLLLDRDALLCNV